MATLGIWLVAAPRRPSIAWSSSTSTPRWRAPRGAPTARGELSDDADAAVFRRRCAPPGSTLLYLWVNPLTMWLTFATFVGYAVIYTVMLKPLTPQNIVIGGASGAMPPVLGWAAMRSDVGPEALMLFLIIFLWTPPHFWALALYRVEDYRKAGLPMLPVTHGTEFTRLQVLLYTLILFAATPAAVHLRHEWLALSGRRAGAGRRFIGYALALWRDYSDALARSTFRFSIWSPEPAVRALLVDHYLRPCDSVETPSSSPSAGSVTELALAADTADRLRPAERPVVEANPSRPSISPAPTTRANWR